MTGGRQPGEDWLCEEQAPGLWLCLGVRRWLVRRRTAYQALDLVETEGHGRVLALDGKFMLSERDEFFYHEMLVHPALLAHPSPEQILIVGGGDGGALREALRHPLRRAVLVEIDAGVLEAAQEWLPSVHQGAFSDPRVEVVIAPGEDFLPKHAEEFDVIIVDSTDPIGPGAALFNVSFFEACRAALREPGFLALQTGSPFLQPSELKAVIHGLAALFPVVVPYLGFMPLYPSGMWSYVLASTKPLPTAEEFTQRFLQRDLRTRYFTPAMFQAATVIPPFLKEALHSCPNA
ncbi:MAG: polyamine aminopropyltransferase [Candidatus Bipolaricaulota bacterium]|nr:polyamine aminopropyltransferase [Candidatus Bipolaricaulota bacterium]MDW8126244.1 polyamine aminopropyltransferase [Candidatus Bipolaricaulota bacterium]